MNNIEKISLSNQDELDRAMHFMIGGSWDYVEDKYPSEYPCVLVISKDRQSRGYVYASDITANDVKEVSL